MSTHLIRVFCRGIGLPIFSAIGLCLGAIAEPVSPPLPGVDASAIVPAAQLPSEINLSKGAGRGGHIRVMLRLEDGQEVPVIFDTGSPDSLIDKSFEPKLGKRLHKTEVGMFQGSVQKAGVYASPKLYLGNVQLMTGTNISTYDFKGWNSKGIIGMDCLKHYCLQLDFQAGKIRFLDPNHLVTTSLGTAYPITFTKWGFVSIHHGGFLGGESTNVLNDTVYANDPKWKSRELPITYVRLDTGWPVDGRAQGTAHGAVHLAKCIWDGQTYTNLVVNEGTNANIMGLRFMARHLVTFDFPGHMLYLKQTSVGPLVDKDKTNH